MESARVELALVLTNDSTCEDVTNALNVPQTFIRAKEVKTTSTLAEYLLIIIYFLNQLNYILTPDNQFVKKKFTSSLI